MPSRSSSAANPRPRNSRKKLNARPDSGLTEGMNRFFPLVMTLLGLGCATAPASNVGPQQTASEYAPYQIGSSWTYAVNLLGEKQERTVEILEQKDGYFVDSEQGQFRHTKDGLRDPQRYLIRHPIEEGNAWKAIVSASAVEHYRILSVGDACASQAGSFKDCLVIESRLRRDDKVTLHIRWTWARDVGLVKIETAADIAGKGRVPQTEQSLVHYGLAGSPPDKAKEEAAPDTWER